MSTIDGIVILLYCIVVAAVGIRAGGRQRDETDFFLGGRELPWWAVCFSVVATETSTLTVIGIPAVAYVGSFAFMQLAIGYIIGRFVVAYVLLPRYFAGNLTTAYAFLGERFGPAMRSTASITFLVTRLLADGVRLFATAIPLKLIADASGWNASYASIIVLIGLVTIAYTLVGGIRAVVWMDVVQMFIYIGGALLAAVLLAGTSPEGWWSAARAANKTQVFDFASSASFRSLLTSPYAFVTAVVGGAFLSIASHGSDHLIVQRLLSCKSLAEGRKAVIVSGFVVAAQFALFLLLGILLWSHYGGLTPEQMGLSRGDEIFPYYILTGMPTGIAGLIVAGIVAAAMSTLSSSLNSLASSTMFDLEPLWRPVRRVFDRVGNRSDLWFGRLLTGFWGLVFMIFASVFTEIENSVVVLGLSIASFTYGGLLGAFMLGIVNPRANQADAIVALVVTIVAMVVIGLIRIPPDGPFSITFIGFSNSMATSALKAIAWPWYPVIGTTVSVAVGTLLALRHRAA